MKKRLLRKISNNAWRLGFLQWIDRIKRTQLMYYKKCYRKYNAVIETEWLHIRRKIYD